MLALKCPSDFAFSATELPAGGIAGGSVADQTAIPVPTRAIVVGMLVRKDPSRQGARPVPVSRKK